VTVYRAGVETAARHLALLSDVVTAATSSLELDEVLQRVAAAIAAALETDACFVYELDAARGELVLGASVGSIPRDGPTPRMRIGEGITGHAAQTLEPIAIPQSAHLDPRFRGFANLDEEAFESILAVPVLARGSLAGALNVRTHAPREYDEDEVALLVTIAAQLGQAMENARLWGRSQRRIAELEALDRISRVVHAPMDLDEVLADVVRTAAEAAHADVCALALPPSAGQPFEVAVRSSDSGASTEALADAARRAPVDEPGLLAVPLETRRGRIGALVCARLEGPPFTRSPPRRRPRSSVHAARCGACSPRRFTTASRTTCRPWPRCCVSQPRPAAIRTARCATPSDASSRSPRSTIC
jgi:putative methionine-R-sulfoxide reductase with GAF domain